MHKTGSMSFSPTVMKGIDCSATKAPGKGRSDAASDPFGHFGIRYNWLRPETAVYKYFGSCHVLLETFGHIESLQVPLMLMW